MGMVKFFLLMYDIQLVVGVCHVVDSSITDQ